MFPNVRGRQVENYARGADTGMTIPREGSEYASP